MSNLLQDPRRMDGLPGRCINGRGLKTAKAIALFLCPLASLGMASHAGADLNKLDAVMQRAAEQTPAPAGSVHEPGFRQTAKTAMIAATVHFSGDALGELRAHGVVVRSVLGDVATLMLPRDRLAEIQTS